AAAMQRAEATGRPAPVAEAAYGAAFARLAAGDLPALRQDVAACIAASRASRDPLRQLRAELLLCEQLRRSGERDEAMRSLVRVRRIPSSALPRILRCRREMVAEILAPGDAADVSEIVRRHIASTGLHALALLVPKAARTRPLHGAPSTPVDDAIEMMRVCQSAADEATTLSAVCEQLQ